MRRQRRGGPWRVRLDALPWPLLQLALSAIDIRFEAVRTVFTVSSRSFSHQRSFYYKWILAIGCDSSRVRQLLRGGQLQKLFPVLQDI